MCIDACVNLYVLVEIVVSHKVLQVRLCFIFLNDASRCCNGRLASVSQPILLSERKRKLWSAECPIGDSWFDGNSVRRFRSHLHPLRPASQDFLIHSSTDRRTS